MAVTLTDALARAILDSGYNAVFNSGTLEIRTGAPPGPGAVPGGSLLVSIPLPADAFAAAAARSITDDCILLAVAIRENAGGGGITGTSSTTLALGQAADTDVLVQATHAQPVALGRTESGSVLDTGAHNATLALGRTQAGAVLVQATSTHTLSLTSQSQGGSPALLADAAATLALASNESGGVLVTGSHARTLALTSQAQGGSPAVAAESQRLLTLAGLAAGVVTGEGVPEPAVGGGGRLRGLRASMPQSTVLVANAAHRLALESDLRAITGRVLNGRSMLAMGSTASGTVENFGDDEIVLLLEALT